MVVNFSKEGVTRAVTIIVMTKAEKVFWVSADVDKPICAHTSATSPLGIIPTPIRILLIPFFLIKTPLTSLPIMAIGIKNALNSNASLFS